MSAGLSLSAQESLVTGIVNTFQKHHYCVGKFVKSFKARLDNIWLFLNICVYWSVDWVDNKLPTLQAIYESYFDCY